MFEEKVKVRVNKKTLESEVFIPRALRYIICNHLRMGNEIISYRTLPSQYDSQEDSKLKEKDSWFSTKRIASEIQNYTEDEIFEHVDYSFDTDPFFKVFATKELLRKQLAQLKEFTSKILEENKIRFNLSLSKNMLNVDQYCEFLEDKIVSFQYEGKLCAMKVTFIAKKVTMTGEPYLAIKGTVYVKSAKGFKKAIYEVNTESWNGAKPINLLSILPITEKQKDFLINRGKKYVEITENPTFIKYNGILINRGEYTVSRYQNNNRVVIDHLAMHLQRPDYYKFYGTLSCTLCETICFSDEMYICTPPVAYGFSLANKEWGEIFIDELEPISFKESAWDNLILPTQVKRSILGTVANKNRQSEDIIENKGGGSIILLAGPPGCGKTTSAEAVAELLKKPLYTVSVGELGTSTTCLEESLKAIFETAKAWDAVLLIDEVDIFLESRSDLNLERNALVGIFLRQLEYYNGVLFLTTNRIRNLDQAFFSRVSQAIIYKNLDQPSRLQVWKNLANLYKLFNIDFEKLSQYPLNGRSIKNIIKIGSNLANYEARVPVTEDFIPICESTLEFTTLAINEK